MTTEDWILVIALVALAVALYVNSNDSSISASTGTTNNYSLFGNSIWAVPAILGAWWLFFV